MSSYIYTPLLYKLCTLIYGYWLNKIDYSQLLEALKASGIGVTWEGEKEEERGEREDAAIRGDGQKPVPRRNSTCLGYITGEVARPRLEE